MNTCSNWDRFQKYFVRYSDLGISLDISRMDFSNDFLGSMKPRIERAMADLKTLEAGEIANPDEGRMVGHYWLRNPDLAPTEELKAEIKSDLENAKSFAKAVHSGEIKAPNGKTFTHLLLVGIGGSALGPQLVSEALAGVDSPMKLYFFDNTDPDGMDRDLGEIGEALETTLTLVISKSGGTKETRNGMLEAEAAYKAKGLNFAAHAAAVTGVGSLLDKHAESQGWIKRFPMADWVGGRTSVMSVVGLVPATLQGVDVDAFLAGAAAVDEKTRKLSAEENISMLMALMWYSAGNGKGEKDMVVLPYKDRLVLFSKYLQQLVMESLGKEHDLDGNVVNQGVAVYGNKGSTDQHAYVQQLRDGVNNFFVNFIEVRQGRDGSSMEVEPNTTTADYLQGFFRGTQSALAGSDRESMTLSIPQIDAFYLGGLIGLFERAVSFYASLVNINAYHQPGVEAGKKAAGEFLELLLSVRGALGKNGKTAGDLAAELKADPEDVFHCLNHLAANGSATLKEGEQLSADQFSAI